ncbi:3-hydroxyacyl-CoA dehydrogenase family protein [Microlunatus sp. Gsoil 973]|uniref:3-hydroxyacyl-CoA dehydrogenase family protein n=1 Tax=Microlunatus sp. Gsoil 973 TaxID=2672569 RepID=UPI0012B48FB8|nr:3-hydroxyacyl-CoA dehydrogenase family protein [Microlunatus sp. Gsoil 973]QGN32226.1 3-hydroxyacyl-CoA dehydrogenase family protein [Microlunatus sp. Gsoil 973]
MSQLFPTVAVVGSGYMGGGIGQSLALAGHDVRLADVSARHAVAARDRLLAESDHFVAAGLFPAGSTDLLAERLTAVDSVDAAVDGADYVTEAVSEDREVKRESLQRIGAVARPDAVIGTNTSAMPIGELAAWVPGPQRFLGVHWWNPAPFVPGVELIPTPDTDEQVITAVEEMIIAAGKSPARVSDSPGFVGNRLQFALYREAALIVEEGLATPDQVDTVVNSTFGFRLGFFGPFAIADMAGLDVYAGAYQSLQRAYGDRLAAPSVLTDAIAVGRLGTKSGGGLLDIPADQLAALIEYRNTAYQRLSELRRELGPPPGLG